MSALQDLVLLLNRNPTSERYLRGRWRHLVVTALVEVHDRIDALARGECAPPRTITEAELDAFANQNVRVGDHVLKPAFFDRVARNGDDATCAFVSKEGVRCVEPPGHDAGYHEVRMPDPTAIQPTMKTLVEFLNARGFHTTDSGDGKLNVEAGMEGAIPIPHVVVLTSHQKLIAMADELHMLIVPLVKDPTQVHIEATYSPDDTKSTIMLFGITDADVIWDRTG